MTLELDKIYLGDCKELLDNISNDSIRLIHTSPPYNINRKYNSYFDSKNINEYINFIRVIMEKCYLKLIKGGVLFWQTGYTRYHKDKKMYPIDYITYDIFNDIGFELRDRIIWRYYGGMAFKNKFSNKHETILWWVKPGEKTYFEVFPVREDFRVIDSRNNLFGKNPGNVWEVDRVAYGANYQTSHIAVFPEEISDRIVLSCSRPGDICLDPFSGSGTLPFIAKLRGRRFIGIEISEEYFRESNLRLNSCQFGEFKNVLSEIILLITGYEDCNYYIEDIIDMTKSMKDSINFEHIIGKKAFSAIVSGDPESVDKSEKIDIWNKLESVFSNNDIGNDAVLMVDRAFNSRYRLTRNFNKVMRLYLAQNWYNELKEILFESNLEYLTDVFKEIFKEENVNYDYEGGKVYIHPRSLKEEIITTSNRDAEMKKDEMKLF